MREIGGYFELELPASQTEFIHSDCVFLNSGRHALEYIFRSIEKDIKKIWLPYYTCEVILQPVKRLGLSYEFYHINSSFEIGQEIPFKQGEFIIANNYFGIKDNYIKDLAQKYDCRLIVDNAQAWYAQEIPGVPVFYSPRKFFGIPDGGLAKCMNIEGINFQKNYSTEKCLHLLKRIDENAGAGYNDFRLNSKKITEEPIMLMSNLSKRILSSINFDKIEAIRRSNFIFLDKELRSSNMLALPSFEDFECPMIYPYMVQRPGLRQKLIDNKVFVATYWPNILKWCTPETLEYQLAKNIIPLPIDQRYGENDMKKILNIILA